MSNRNARLIRELERMRLPELQERFRAIVGEETRCPNRTFLMRRIREALEAQAAAPAPTAPVASAAIAAAAHVLAEAPAAVSAAHEVVAPSPTVPSEAPTPPAPPSETGAAPAPANDREMPPVVAAPAPSTTRAVAAPAARPRPAARRGRDANVPARRARERPVRGRFKSMTVEELQTLYLSVVGRPTGSDDRRYLIWKIREAEKGRIPVGPRETRTPAQESHSDMRILPLRLDARRVAAIDATWRARGMRSRMDLFRHALALYLAHVGAHGAAALFEAP